MLRQEHHLAFLCLGFCICGMETGAIYLAEGTPCTMVHFNSATASGKSGEGRQRTRGGRLKGCPGLMVSFALPCLLFVGDKVQAQWWLWE